MPDWQKLVSQRLAHLALEERDREKVFAELAGHLEESHESLLRQGDSEHEAIPRVLSQVADCQDLQRKIYSARTKENNLTSRVSRLWLPGLFTFAISMGLLSVAQKFGPSAADSEFRSPSCAHVLYALVADVAFGRCGGCLSIEARSWCPARSSCIEYVPCSAVCRSLSSGHPRGLAD